MAFGVYAVPDFPDDPVGTDPIRAAHDSQERFPQEGLHSPRAVQFQQLEIGIGNQREVQLEPRAEVGVRFRVAAAAADYHRIALFKFLEGVTKLGRFVRSTGGIGFGEKIEDHVLAAESSK